MEYSIILPAYNVENYIRECIESILKIDLDFELIIVNDGSTDGTEEVIKKFHDKRIQLITQENQGLSAARNRGIKLSKGKYILFIDSDDFVDSSMTKKYLEKMSKNQLDLLIGNGYDYLTTSKSKKIIKEQNVLNPANIYEGESYYKEALRHNDYYDAVWINVYNSRIIKENNIYFIPGRLHEDIEWLNEYILCCSRVMIEYKPFYYYRKRENSITTTPNIKTFIDKVQISKKLYKSGEKINCSKLQILIKTRASHIYIYNMIGGIINNRGFINQVTEDRSIIKYASKKSKVKYYLCIKFPLVSYYSFQGLKKILVLKNKRF